jgi:transposase-like protein
VPTQPAEAVGGQRRTSYTPAEQAAAYLHLQAHSNISQASRDLNISRTTLHGWLKDWEENGLPEAVQKLIDEADSRFLDKAEQTRDKALAKLDKLIDAAEDPKLIVGLATALGIIHDKIVAVRSKQPPKKRRTPGRKAEGGGLSEDAIKAFASDLVSQAEQRNAEIGASNAEQGSDESSAQGE